MKKTVHLTENNHDQIRDIAHERKTSIQEEVNKLVAKFINYETHCLNCGEPLDKSEKYLCGCCLEGMSK